MGEIHSSCNTFYYDVTVMNSVQYKEIITWGILVLTQNSYQ